MKLLVVGLYVNIGILPNNNIVCLFLLGTCDFHHFYVITQWFHKDINFCINKKITKYSPKLIYKNSKINYLLKW